ncbi:MBL fold metallo-hydrolase [Jeotgalibacillus proteolyticus]|uniref:MBL fold metallo-hydrolase n=1 Tax=Jeotgalibacillus proteolyticus TaxID=2082395 RepID=A0A2S5GAQ3_9BACL|nr:MBL fold metallo-hydrolase [Jeotgalibacillus proteolyticus]PPA70070.1 MBL fold metallo-hydrolase [Jeotgalibacillus proteolyticus]
MIDIKVLGSSSKGNAYRISDGRTSLLLEAGIKFRDIQRKLDFKTSDLAGCLISHEHGDHRSGLKDVLRAGIDVYMSPGTAEAIGIDHHRVNKVENKKPFKIGTWTVMPFDVQHDVSEPFGFLLQNQAGEKLLFATDTYYIRYKFQNLTHIMIETNYSMNILKENIAAGRVPSIMRKRLMQSHFSLEHALDFFKANDLSKVQEIWLLHLSDNNSDEEFFKREVQKVTGKIVKIAK